MNEFFAKCIEAGCLIIPVRAYSQFPDEGNCRESDLIGTKYLAVSYDSEIAGPDFYVGLECHHCTVSLENFFDTPEEALQSFCEEQRKQA